MTESPVLQIQVRRKCFAGQEVLRDVRLELQEGECVTLVGASGCGKSTLLRIVAGLDRDHEGEVRLNGKSTSGPTRDIRFVFQEPRLFPWLTVAGNVAFDGSGPVDAPRVEALLCEVGLAGFGARLPKELSGGQAQRVAIARGLFVRPRVLLLDEPFSAVDAFTRLKLQELLLRIARAHRIAVLMVTHDIDEAVYLGDRVLVFEADPGRIGASIPVVLPQPRDRDSRDVNAVVSTVRHALQRVHAF
ncbi:ABC transporter ATP-binding protein [Variovorax saccharolyticus]|uniref:ABC transporter ATP-binding protein n=1 Tax=Variovorax saccharolyticus TaxID=3053516 RepID=UPI0025789E46|nr:ABC transporter ATP-binding protein [Variovorax sp. J31P216]MDM0029963.1 ABC transporter ATP-binding protein [Variovorax sp. J31P216]